MSLTCTCNTPVQTSLRALQAGGAKDYDLINAKKQKKGGSYRNSGLLQASTTHATLLRFKKKQTKTKQKPTKNKQTEKPTQNISKITNKRKEEAKEGRLLSQQWSAADKYNTIIYTFAKKRGTLVSKKKKKNHDKNNEQKETKKQKKKEQYLFALT